MCIVITRYEPSLYSSHRNNTGTLDEFDVDSFSVVGATDTTSGKVVWKHKVPQLDHSRIVVAGDLVFYGEDSGKFHAVNAKTGKVLKVRTHWKAECWQTGTPSLGRG